MFSSLFVMRIYGCTLIVQSWPLVLLLLVCESIDLTCLFVFALFHLLLFSLCLFTRCKLIPEMFEAVFCFFFIFLFWQCQISMLLKLQSFFLNTHMLYDIVQPPPPNQNINFIYLIGMSQSITRNFDTLYSIEYQWERFSPAYFHPAPPPPSFLFFLNCVNTQDCIRNKQVSDPT